ncbi:ADP-ribosylation factor-like protein 16 isoform X3 [Camelus ferus]|uniref:ADP-ribosylation factor-like protein 16 isoform X3 n=1 Tax=Camelus ferus TaxID=419612 RepID=A0A8B8R5W9_CAMFR|nr:ADP-ribosylation factor-like protein 16 isoform X3 [Camelus ferus]
MCLLLGATGVGKTLLVKRLQKLSSRDGKGDLGDPPPTRPTVGTNLTDIVAQSKITIRELGGCMGPIWPSYYGNCRSLLTCALDSRRSNLPWRSNGPTSRETSVEVQTNKQRHPPAGVAPLCSCLSPARPVIPGEESLLQEPNLHFLFPSS